MDAPAASEDTAVTVRPARADDAGAVSRILAEAFPALYRATFGPLREGEIAALLTDLYRGGFLTLENTRLAEREGRVVGLCILHVGHSIGRGSAAGFWRLLRGRLRLVRAPRAFLGGLSTNAYLGRRIPHAPDLAYIEALAVEGAERGRGTGSLLLLDAEAWARARGFSRIALHVLARNEGARRLYARHGFRPWHEVKPPPRPSPWAALRMVRCLDPAPDPPAT